jgi:GT2 family glycosyltransferase
VEIAVKSSKAPDLDLFRGLTESRKLDVSIIIVTWNSASFIGKCLASIYEQTQSCSFEVVVVDNGSKDQTIEIVSRQFSRVRIVSTGMNLGFPRASNLGIGISVGRHIFLLNPDTFLRSDVAGELVRFLETNPHVGAAGPRVLERNRTVDLFAAREFPSVSGTLFTVFGFRKLLPRRYWIDRRSLPDHDEQSARSVPCLTGAALMIPRRILNLVGLLDERLPLYFEDLDICSRIRSSGKDLCYVPSAELVHIGGQSAGVSPLRATLWAMEKGQAPWMWFREYRGRGAACGFSLSTFLGSVVRCVAFAVFMPVACLGGGELTRWVRGNLRKSSALVCWSLSSKLKSAERMRELFAPDSVSDFAEKPRSTVMSEPVVANKS